MRVPEAAVYENHGLVMRKNNVRATCKAFVVFSEAEAELKKLGAQGDFEFSAGASDCGHVFVTLFERKRVCGKFNSGKLFVWVSFRQ